MSEQQDLMTQVRKVKDRYEPMLMKKPHVVGVGIGVRQCNNQPTGELALIVNVRRKIPASLLAPQDLIPRELDGVPVDVRETGHVAGI